MAQLPGNNVGLSGWMRALRAALALLLLCAPGLFLAFCTTEFSQRTPQAYDQIQASRYTAQTRRLATNVVKPLALSDMLSNGDGTLPDFEHAPLYTALSGAALALVKQTTPGAGERGIAFLGGALLSLAIGASAWFASRVTPGRGHFRAAALFAFGGGALGLLVEPHPAILAAILATALFGALVALDIRSEPRRNPRLWLAAAAGALFSLLWLSAYSALILLPVLLWHVGRITRRSIPAIALFCVAAGVVAAPQCWRAFRSTGDPLYHGRRIELIFRTTSHPGDSLYRSTSLPTPLGDYLASGGVREIATKTARQSVELAPRLIATIGPAALLLFLASTLIRFQDPRVNRLRNLVCVLVPLHALGLSAFFPADETAPLFLLYAPVVATIGGAFLESVLRARQLPVSRALAALWAWTALGCAFGALSFFSGTRPTVPVSALYAWLNFRDPFVARIRAESIGLLASNDAPEMAFRLDIPIVVLPLDAVEFEQVQQRTSKNILGFAVTPRLRREYDGSRMLSPWAETYSKIIGLWIATAELPKEKRDRLRTELAPRYPDAIRDAVRTFQPLPVIDEQRGGEYSIIFWNVQGFGPRPLAPR